MHARHRFAVPLLLALVAIIAGCSKPAPQPTGSYAGQNFEIHFDTTSRLTFVGQRGMPDIHCDYTQDGDTLHVVSDKTAAKHFEATLRIEDDGKFISLAQFKDTDTGKTVEGNEKMSKVLDSQ